MGGLEASGFGIARILTGAHQAGPGSTKRFQLRLPQPRPVPEDRPPSRGHWLIGSRQWPLLAACMQKLSEHDGPDTVARHLNRCTSGTFWQEVTSSTWSAASSM